MPICKNCSCNFPNRIWIDGQRKILSRRKYCLECSPFGSPRKTILKEENSNRKCKVCSKEYIYCHKKGHTNEVCNSCLVNSRRFIIKDKMLEYKGNKCSLCGYNKSKRALEFHHRNKEEKIFNISGCHCFSWEKIKNELDKCELLCSNCHKEIEEIEDKKNFLTKKLAIEEFIVPRKPKEPNVCPVCKIEFFTYNKKTIYCSNKCSHQPRLKLVVSKEELEELLKSKTITQISRMFGVSFNAVKKKCNKLGLVKSRN